MEKAQKCVGKDFSAPAATRKWCQQGHQGLRRKGNLGCFLNPCERFLQALNLNVMKTREVQQQCSPERQLENCKETACTKVELASRTSAATAARRKGLAAATRPKGFPGNSQKIIKIIIVMIY